MPPQKISFKASIHPQLKRQITLLLWSHTQETLQQTQPIQTMTETVVLKGTTQALLPANTAAHVALQIMDIPINPCTMIMTGTVAPYPALVISPTGATHTTPDQRHSHSSNSCHAAQDSHPQEDKAMPKNLNPPKTITIQDSPSDSSSDSDSDSDPLNY